MKPRSTLAVALLTAAFATGLPAVAGAQATPAGPSAKLAIDEAACAPDAIEWVGTLTVDLPAGASVTSTYRVGPAGEAGTVLDAGTIAFPAAVTLTQPASDAIGFGAAAPVTRPYVYEHRTEVRLAGDTAPVYTQWARITCDPANLATVTLTESFAGTGEPVDPDDDGTPVDDPVPATPATPIAATPRFTG